MQQATSSQTPLSKKDQCFHDQHPLFVAHEMQNTTSIMSLNDNVITESVYNPTCMFMTPLSSCSSELQFYLDTNLSSTQGDDEFLLINNIMGQSETSYHPLYKYQMSYPSSSSSTITTSTPKSRHNSTAGLLKDEEEDEEYKLMDKTKNSISLKREKTLEKNRQAASRCRQRKKEWLNQLQTNVERLTRENKILEEQSMSLREEIINLKTILLSHKDCSQSNKPDAIDISKLFYKTNK